MDLMKNLFSRKFQLLVPEPQFIMHLGTPNIYLQHYSSRRFLYVHKTLFKKTVKVGPRQTVPYQYAQISYDQLHRYSIQFVFD